MHRLRSLSVVMRFRFAALLLVVNCLFVPVFVGLLIEASVTGNPRLIVVGAALAPLCLVLVITQWVVASRTACPLCLTPVLAPKSCMKHRRAKAFMGSYRLRVALEILFINHFRCPYCHEPTTLVLHDPRRPARHASCANGHRGAHAHACSCGHDCDEAGKVSAEG